MTNVIDLDARRITPYIIQAVELFLLDPPDCEFQRGYLAAILNVWIEGVGRNVHDARIVAAQKLLRLDLPC